MPAGEESPHAGGKVRWGEHEGRAAPPHCRHPAFWHQQSKHADSAFLYLLFHLSKFKTVLKTINFCFRRMMLSCVYLAASLRAFRGQRSCSRAFQQVQTLETQFKTKGEIMPQSCKLRTDTTNCDKDLKQGTSIWRQMIALIF